MHGNTRYKQYIIIKSPLLAGSGLLIYQSSSVIHVI